jgi:hypothetical protein
MPKVSNKVGDGPIKMAKCKDIKTKKKQFRLKKN